MRERANAAGGTIDIGPLPDGGFRVAARLPLGQPSATIEVTASTQAAATAANTASAAANSSAPPRKRPVDYSPP